MIEKGVNDPMSKKLFVLSVDAMVTEDVDAIREMPNFKKYFGVG